MNLQLVTAKVEQGESGLRGPDEVGQILAQQVANASSSRRAFLGRGLTAAAVPAAIVGAGSIADASTPVNGPLPSFYPNSTIRAFQEIQVDEYNHVLELTTIIQNLGGTPRPLPTFQNLIAKTPAQFLMMATTFENVGVHAYYGAGAYISSPSVLSYALSIALVEAYHSGFLNNLSNTTLVPGGLYNATPYTAAQVAQAVSPYIASLNDPTGMFPATYGTTPSAANDIEILNFALIAEYLEAEFYYYNVPKFFPG